MASPSPSPPKPQDTRHHDEAFTRELRFLREENERLHDAVRRAENALMAAETAASGSPSRQAREKEGLARLEDSYATRLRDVAAREKQVAEDTERWRAEVTASADRVRVLREQLDAATLELEVRERVRVCVYWDSCCRH